MTNESKNMKCECDLGSTLGFLSLRLWLAVRAIFTGLEKYAGQKSIDVPVEIDGAVNDYGLTAGETVKGYGLDLYHGVPQALAGKLEAEPLSPAWALGLFDTLLGPSLILFGITLLLGVATRISLFAMGLIYTGLTVGLILLKQDAGIAWLGIHILLIAVALFTARYNRLAILKKF